MLLVQCDFDDTITVGNVSVDLRERFAPEEWRGLECEYHAGKYSVEESNVRQYALITVSKKEIEEFARTKVVVRESFGGFVDYCRNAGIELVVVSSGLDLYINPTITREGLDGLEVHSARGNVTRNSIEVEYTDPSGKPLVRGFKEAYTREFKRKGYTVVYIGDGKSDIVPASEADFVIARSSLERHLKCKGLPYYGFETFEDVRLHVEEIRQALDS